jgi:hypothetical protein
VLRIEIRKEGERQVEVRELRGLHFTIGRSVQHDVVLTDPRVSRVGARVEFKPDGGFIYSEGETRREANREMKVELGPYTIEFTDLRLLEDEKTNPNFMPSLTRMNRAVVAIVFLGIELFTLLNERFFRPNPHEWPRVLAAMLFVAAGVLLPVLMLSIVSRAVNGDYRFWRLARWFLVSGFGVMFFFSDLGDLRWVLGSWMRIEEFYGSLIGLWLLFCLSRLVAIVFDHLKPWAHWSLIGTLAILGLYLQWSHLIPLKQQHRFAKVAIAPIRSPILESAAVPSEVFLNRLGGVFEKGSASESELSHGE